MDSKPELSATASINRVPLGVESFQVWTKELLPEEIYKESCSPEFYTKAEAEEFIKHNKQDIEGELYITSTKAY